MNYLEFLQTKQHSVQNFGIEPNFIPDKMFDFQKYVTEYLVKKGRGAGFLDTGTGKTIIELTVAKNYIESTNKPVLIIIPLGIQLFIYPLLNIPVTFKQNIIITFIFTIASILRGYVIRRFFNFNKFNQK